MVTKEDIIKLKTKDKINFIYEIPSSFYDCGFEYIIIGNIKTGTKDNLRKFSFDD